MSIVSGTVSAIMGKEGADAQSDAAKYAADLQYKMWEVSVQQMLPFLEASYRALGDYERLIEEGPGNFEESPYYGTLQSGIDMASEAIKREGLAGGVGPGVMGKRLTEYAVPFAAQQRSNWINEWLATKLGPTGQLAQSGPAMQMGQNALLTGRNLGETALYGGEAKASGYLGTAAAVQDTSNQAQNWLLAASKLGWI